MAYFRRYDRKEKIRLYKLKNEIEISRFYSANNFILRANRKSRKETTMMYVINNSKQI